MSGLTDFAAYLRRGGAALVAVLHHIRTGTPVPADLQAAAEEAAQHLLLLSQGISDHERDAARELPPVAENPHEDETRH